MPNRPPRAHPHGQPSVRHRDPAARRFYGSSLWQRIRQAVRRAHPVCQRCHRAPSASVHHKDGDITNNVFDVDHPERSNLEAVCKACHDSISGKAHRAKQT